jgi:outer membrane murein-binding lipoprotein Lpp
MSRSGFTAGLVAAAIAGAVLSACGSSTPTASASSSGGAAATQSSVPTLSVPGGSFCGQVVGLGAQLQHVSSGFLSASPGATPDFDAYKQLFATATSAIDGLAGSAPSEISTQFQTLRSAYDQLNSQVQAATSFTQFGAAASTLGTPAVANAAKAITAYMTNTCGFHSTPTP